uniref:MxaS protein n=1 Tax=Hyphomicrobium methylovorum TaxID=84 RepID=O24764_HYPME|nr:mxaS [Hyphomicrobium methylovorum]
MASDLAQALAICTERAGDTFALYPFDATLRDDLLLRRTHSRAAHSKAVERLRAYRPDTPGVSGVGEAAAALAGSKKLVFLISDFHWSEKEAQLAGETLAFHDVVPIELEDSLETDGFPDWGLVNLRDLETGRRRLIAMRPSLKERWRVLREARRNRVRQVFDASAREMFTIRDRIDWMRLTTYLVYGSA